jgi:hypothetical protein
MSPSRLLAAKQQFDPHGLLFVHHGVGSVPRSADTCGSDQRAPRPSSRQR